VPTPEVPHAVDVEWFSSVRLRSRHAVLVVSAKRCLGFFLGGVYLAEEVQRVTETHMTHVLESARRLAVM